MCGEKKEYTYIYMCIKKVMFIKKFKKLNYVCTCLPSGSYLFSGKYFIIFFTTLTYLKIYSIQADCFNYYYSIYAFYIYNFFS